MSTIKFSVSIPTDGGFLGRACDDHLCGRYYRVHQDSLRDKMHCPYCNKLFSNDNLHTRAQSRHLERVAEEKAQEFMHNEINKMFKDLSRQFGSNSSIKFDYTPTYYRAKTIFPHYREHKVDSELVCPNCSCRFQVFGIFGYCPGCGTENLLVYDANLIIIQKEIQASDNPRRALRHAYSDLVSAFQIFCANKAKRLNGDKPNFQELFPTRKYFKEISGVDMLEHLSINELLVLRRVFQKRHACQHANSTITEQYITKIPEDKDLIGQEVQLSLEEFESGAHIVRKVLDRLCRFFEPRD